MQPTVHSRETFKVVKGLGRYPPAPHLRSPTEERIDTLKNCSQHGPFRGEECPVCGEEGKFLMSEDELNSVGRILAGVLRHFPSPSDGPPGFFSAHPFDGQPRPDHVDDLHRFRIGASSRCCLLWVR